MRRVTSAFRSASVWHCAAAQRHGGLGTDVAVTVRPAPDRKLRYQALLEDPFVLVCRRDDPLATRKWVPWSVFATRPFPATAQQSSIRSITDAVFVQQGI